MLSCRVLVGPIATDKEYQTGDTVCLDKKDADTLTGFGLVEIIGEVEPKFVPTPAPVPVTVAPVVTAPPVVEISEPVVAPVLVETSEPVAAPAEVPVPVVTAPAIETPVPPLKPESPIPTTEETLELEKTETQTQETTTDRKKK